MILVEEDRWLVALPLIDRRMGKLLSAGALPCNAWPSGATLLWDAAVTADPGVSGGFSAALAGLPWPLVFLEAVMPDRASWQALIRGLTLAGIRCDLRTRWHVGRLAIEHDWPAAFSRLSGKHRRRLASCLRRLADQGEVRFRLHAHLAPDEIEPLLGRAWETEDRGWKGTAGTSVLKTPGAAEFLLAQARWLAAEDRLWLALLDCGGHNVAFAYGVFGKGVFHSFKIGYDPAFAPHSPGHLLQCHLLQSLHDDPRVTAIDYIGEMTAYHASWRPETYPFARLAFGRPGSDIGRGVLWGYQWLNGPSEGLQEAAASL